jgi:hypothetical protein
MPDREFGHSLSARIRLALALRETGVRGWSVGDEAMLTYHYALISNPCDRTVVAMFDYVHAHASGLSTLAPADLQAMARAIATTSCDYEREYPREAEELKHRLAGVSLH